MSAPIVRMRVSAPMLLEHLLRLDEGVTLLGAGVDVFGDGTAASLVLYLRHPDAPDGADEIVPVYLRSEVVTTQVAGIQWHAGGQKIAEDLLP